MKDDKHVLEISPQPGGWKLMDLNTGEIDAVMESITPAIAKHFLAGTPPATLGVGLVNLAIRIFLTAYGVESTVVNLRSIADALEEDGDPLETEPPAGNA